MTERKWVEVPHQLIFKEIIQQELQREPANVVRMDQRRSDMTNVTGITGKVDFKAITTWLNSIDESTRAGILDSFGDVMHAYIAKGYVAEQLYRTVWTDLLAGLAYGAEFFNRTQAA